MNQAQHAIDEMLPMISDFLEKLGMAEKEEIDFSKSLNQFSGWITEQVVTQDNYGYLVSRVAAFFCHYYAQNCNATIKEVSNTVRLYLPLGEDVMQSIDPYFFAMAVANKELTLANAISANVS